MSDTVKYVLAEDRIPRAWYNIQADLPEPLPPVLHPGTGEPIGPDDLAPLFPMALIGQEVSTEREIEIPEPVRQIYRQWRPSPLYRARQLEAALDTPAKIYYKYEGVSPAGSHKPNTAVAQAFYNKDAGTKRIATETGAGQWGSSLAYAGSLFGLGHRHLHGPGQLRAEALPEGDDGELRGALRRESVHGDAGWPRGARGASLTRTAASGSPSPKPWRWRPRTRTPSTRSAASSTMFCSIRPGWVGQEALEQMHMAGNYPDILVGCTGGGSNFAGMVNPFLGRQLRGGPKVRIVAVEPAACPSLTRGKYAYDFGDTGHLTPLVKMHTLGIDLRAAGISRGRTCVITGWLPSSATSTTWG